MKALGQGSLASILKLVLDAVWYILWTALVLVALLVVISAGTFVLGLLGYAPEGLSDLVSALTMTARALPVLIAEIVALMVIIDRLRRIFATLIAGDPFVPENAGHLRVIAFAIIVYQIFRHVTQGAAALILTLLGQPIAGGGEWKVTPDIDLGAWFAAVALLVFAEVFREGARMRQEQKLTI